MGGVDAARVRLLQEEVRGGTLTVAEILERLFERFHRPEFIHPDPLEKVRAAPSADREVVGLIASGLALGRVESILEAIDRVVVRLSSPREAVESLSKAELERLFAGFRYRFVTGGQLAALLFGAGECIRRFGSIEGAFRSVGEPGEGTILPALSRFTVLFGSLAGGDLGLLMPDPARGSACKRLHLYLRWMVRRDEIDPGRWRLSRAQLMIPVDVHMLRVSQILGLTQRRQPDRAASIEITDALREICPDDPVKYDFAMTRLGIHPALRYEDLTRMKREEQ